ncbi:hypothetical protein [Virgisporangium ochraceum]|uniref:Uncharacterized protein n=1 Tax=Virgisporangium ochraceum TaxID=65505 RepID=A0A8J4A3W0_9ACTN|nr:hypothetical protein [Virgisporangium ochraceum]GIJ75347.1 hypothetical protein Voc01_102640 [Virgisporangium ochraceum]
MREPRREDDDALATIELVVRLNASPRIVDEFVRAAGSSHADNWFYAGLAAWALMDVTAHSLRKHSLLTSALDHLSTAVSLRPDHWPARFMRASYLTMLHSDEADEMIAFLLPGSYGLAAARDDARTLVDLRSAADPRAPYGLAPYCLLAVQALMDGDEPHAWEALRAGLSRTDAGPAPAMATQLAVPVVIALRRPELDGQPALRAELTRRCRLLTQPRERVT